MASVEFRDEEDNSLRPSHTHMELPDGVVTMTIWAEFGGDYNFDSISMMLERLPKKLQTVTIHDIYRFAPDYLALFTAILQKTERLVLSDSLRHNLEVCQAFQHHSIHDLYLCQLAPISTNQARYIFDGIAYSSSLQQLHLDLIFEEPQDSIPLLVDALQQNRSLKNLSLNVPTGENDRFVSDAIRAAVLDMKLEHFSIIDPRRMAQLPFENLMDSVCRQDCKLESLSLRGIEPSASLMDELTIMASETILKQRNSSVKELTISEVTLNCSRIMETVGLFQSLVSVSLVGTPISDLSPLDSLLIGDNLTLQCLSIMVHQISDQDWLRFIFKIPKMTCLRHLRISMENFKTESWKEAFANAIIRNKSLVQTNGSRFIEPQLTNTMTGSCLSLHINRAWKPQFKPLPLNLLPLVLQRAMAIKYFRDCDDWESPSLESPRHDVVFWLLKEIVVPQTCC